MGLNLVFICGLPRSTTFLHIFSKNRTIFEKKLLNIKFLVLIPLQIFSEAFFILRRTERDVIKNVYRSAAAA